MGFTLRAALDALPPAARVTRRRAASLCRLLVSGRARAAHERCRARSPRRDRARRRGAHDPARRGLRRQRALRCDPARPLHRPRTDAAAASRASRPECSRRRAPRSRRAASTRPGRSGPTRPSSGGCARRASPRRAAVPEEGACATRSTPRSPRATGRLRSSERRTILEAMARRSGSRGGRWRGRAASSPVRNGVIARYTI